MHAKPPTIQEQALASMRDTIYTAIVIADVDRVLPDSKRDSMAADLSLFCLDSIHKYIKGQKEHGGDIGDRQLLQEIRQEIIDLQWYVAALRKKQIAFVEKLIKEG